MDPGAGRILMVVLILAVLGLLGGGGGHGDRSPVKGRSYHDDCLRQKPYLHEWECDLKDKEVDHGPGSGNG